MHARDKTTGDNLGFVKYNPVPLTWRVPFEAMEKNTNATGIRSKSLNTGDCLGQLFVSGDQTREISQIKLNTVDNGGFRKYVCGFFTQDALMVIANNAKLVGIGKPTQSDESHHK
jgi:hypothetical protein